MKVKYEKRDIRRIIDGLDGARLAATAVSYLTDDEVDDITEALDQASEILEQLGYETLETLDKIRR